VSTQQRTLDDLVIAQEASASVPARTIDSVEVDATLELIDGEALDGVVALTR
jgi:hypothetical protein